MGSAGRAAGVTSAVARYLRGCVRVDTRSLAAFRIAVSLLVLADLGLRARRLTYFYTDAGVVPRSLAAEPLPLETLSVYALSGSPRVTAALFGFHALVALALLVGYRTRVATMLTFVFVVSLDLRNVLVLSYADTLFAWLLFWSIFLPLGERWSIDALHADQLPRAAVSSVGSTLLLGQMITMYVVNGYHKTAAESWHTGEAAVIVLGLDHITFLFGDLLRVVPALLEMGGRLWFYMLLSAWLLVFARGRPRTLLVVLFMSVHLSFGLTVRIGAFAFVAIAGVILFLQASFWDDAARLTHKLQNAWPTGRVLRIDDLRARVVGFATAIPYTTVGTSSGPRTLVQSRRRLIGFAISLFIVFALVSAFSAGGLAGTDGPLETTERAVTGFVDHQTEWSIFAPEPRETDRYYVFAAKTANGAHLDVYNDRKLRYDRPDGELQHQFDTYRERFYMSSVDGDDPSGTAERLATHYCTEWEDDGDRLTHINFYRIDEEVTRETIDSPADRNQSSVLLYEHGCGAADPLEIDPPAF